MKRRTLLKSVLGLPLVNPTVSSATPSTTSQTVTQASKVLYSGLAGLDYAMGGLKPAEMSCFLGPPCMGKTMLLLELATRLVDRYNRNVFFYSANQPLYYLWRKMSFRCGIRTRVEEICNFVDEREQGDDSPAVVMLDFARPPTLALQMVSQLASVHPSGCATLIMDGWITYRPRTALGQSPRGIVAFPAERWPHGLISTDILAQASRVAADLGAPVVFGATTASHKDDENQSDSRELETQLRIRLDHWVSLDRMEMSREPAQRKPDERDMVRLTGSSPHWWDTRYSKLRFDPRRLRFATVV